jgi:hypothetical protein
MNKTVKLVVIAAVVVLTGAVLGVGFAFAQGVSAWGGVMRGGYGMMGGDAWRDGTPAPGYGSGMMGSGYGMMGGDNAWMQAMHAWGTGPNAMHTLVWNGLAEALDLTPDELSAELANGKTLAQVAEERGVSQAQLASALEQSVKTGLDQAVTDGVLTRQQADQMLSQMAGRFEWMLSHMGGRMGPGFGTGGCHSTTVPQTDL